MTNIERLKMEISDIQYIDSELEMFLAECGLEAEDTYNPNGNINKKGILSTTLAILEAIANNPQLMKSYKTEDMTITRFAENLQNRIDALERKIRMMPSDDVEAEAGATFKMMFN